VIGRTLAHYRITAAIGAGGMGQVYRATDTKLGRDIALKVLPAEMASSDEMLERFRREARAVAALNHPHIVTIFSVEEADGVHFLTMELVEGQSLDRLIPAGGLPVERILAIAAALSGALAAAHEKGIVHRDLKPANVMVTDDGGVKVLDFGLAKELRPVDEAAATVTSAGHTEAGVVMGTRPYMSPEQVQGRPLDHRTDLFSLGVVLYEMTTGQRPFRGQSSADLFASILRDDAPPVTEVRADLPADLVRVIRRCLERDPRRRIQTARDIGNELRDTARPAESAAFIERARVSSGEGSGPTGADEGFWVAVLPFKCAGPSPEVAALADGMSEGIVSGLSRFSYLRVIAQSSTSPYGSGAVDVRTVGKAIGARYVMEGSLRQAGSQLRVAVQLADATTGAHLWAETYERPFRAEDLFALQDDLVPRIVSTVADWYGVLPRTLGEAVRGKAADELSPYEAVLRGFGYYQRVRPDEHAAVRAGLERAVGQAPQYADAWVMLSMMYGEEHRFSFNVRPDPLGRALQAARRAADAAPSNHLAHLALAQALFFRKDFAAFRSAAERALALNPMDGSTGAYIGHLMAFAGDWERGCDVFERARELNPHHPDWYWALPFYDAYRRGDDRRALTFAPRFATAGIPLTHAMHAALYGQLGETAAARQALQQLLRLAPDYALSVREELDRWYQPDLVERMIDGLRKAGLTIPDDAGSAASSAARDTAPSLHSGETPADESFRVAVLPFAYSGASADVVALAEGISEAIVTGLSRFSYLKVVARGSTLRYANEAIDVRAAGRQIGARYVMEGSLRQAGSVLRIAAHLVDVASGAHLWAETYDRTLVPDEIFALQDELVPRIVSTVADVHGVLPRSMSEAVRSRPPEELSPYEAVLRSFGYFERVTADELAAARAGLQSAVRKAPAYADAWAMLALLNVQEHGQGFNLRANSLASGLTAARRAVEAAPSSHLAHFSLAQALFFHKELASFRNAAERAIALNPMDGNSIAFLGELLTYAGDRERGLALAERAKELNPHHPGWYWYANFYDAYRQGDDRAALGFALKVNLPGHWGEHAMKAAVYGQLGEREAAGKALRELLGLRPDFVATARAGIEKWWQPDYVERVIDGWRKAGLDLPANASAASPSGEARADEGFWVAVLPFKYSGPNPEISTLAEGLAEGIVTGLSRFSYLRVITRSSTASYGSGAVDVRAAAQQIGARYVMEGSLRQAGSQLRVAVQLVDAGTGAHLWAETYNRTFDPDAAFALQDDLVARIVSTCADTFGVLARSISDAVRGKPSDQLSPYEALMRGFGYHHRLTPVEHAEAREALERAVERAPANADCRAMLSWIYSHEHAHGFNARPGSLDRALAAARRAVDLAPSNHLAHQALAVVLFFRKDTTGCLGAAERAMALNPLDGSNEAIFLITFSGDWERGCALIRRAMELNPHHPRWYEVTLALNEYRQARYREAVDQAVKANARDVFWTNMLLAAAHAQLGELADAQGALRDLLAQKADFAQSGQPLMEKWFGPQLVDHFMEGLGKAGLAGPE